MRGKLNTIGTLQPGRHGLVSSPLEETTCASSAHAADAPMEKIVIEDDEDKDADEDSVKAWRSGSVAATTRRILLDAPALELRSLSIHGMQDRQHAFAVDPVAGGAEL